MDEPFDIAAVKSWIRSARKSAGHSQRTLAEAAGTTRRTIFNLESNGDDVSLGSGRVLYAVMLELGLVRGPGEVVPSAHTTVRRDRPEELSAGVELILDETAKGFQKLSRRLARLEKRLPPAAEQDDRPAKAAG